MSVNGWIFKRALKNEILINTATWMNIKDIMQSEKKSDTNLRRKWICDYGAEMGIKSFSFRCFNH